MIIHNPGKFELYIKRSSIVFFERKKKEKAT
jgi:hypothetical protein